MDQTLPRGRARGRARAVAEQQAAPGPGPVATRPAGACSAGNPIRSAGGPPAAAIAIPSAAISSTVALVPSGESSSSRGAMRGRRPLPETILATKLPNLGKQGTDGRPIVLQTNYFRLETRANWCINQYRVDFAPEIDVTMIKRKLFRIATASMKNIQGIFDGSVFFAASSFRISPDPMEIVVDSLTDSNQKVRITIRLVGVLDPGSYHNIVVYNLIMRKCMAHLNLQEIKRNYFDPAAKIVVSEHNLELWPGIVTSIRQHESALLMCAEVKHKVLKTDTALHLLMRMRHDQDYQAKFKQCILNRIVLTDYNNRTHRIDDVDFTMTPASTFTRKDGSQCSFAEYYRSAYGLTIREMRQPLLVSMMRPERGTNVEVRIQLVPELCRMTGLTEEERNNRYLKTALEPYLQPGPASRITHLRNFNQRLQNTPASIQEMRNFDITLSKDILSLNGRVLHPEKLKYHNGQFVVEPRADWSKDIRSKPLFRNGQLDKWAMIYSWKDRQAVQSFMKLLVAAANGMRWTWGQPDVKELCTPAARPHDKAAYARCIEEVLAQNAQVTFFMIIVPPSRSSDTFSTIKKKLSVEKGIASQCVAASTCVHKNAMSIATKLAMQMCSKTGGAPWSIVNPLKGLMVVGYDVCHDTGNKANSFGAFVASYDANLTAYYSQAMQHRDGEELSDKISTTMTIAVNHYAEKNGGELPTYILFYRDGVGEGQLCYVYEHELKNIQASLGLMYQERGVELRMRTIIVNKRHNTRLFDQGRNPPPGTVVDDVITLPERTDFFLVSQCSNKGTASPTYYSILGPDNFGLDISKTQLLTHRLCHQYYNWSGTVRVPAPCQYAHKLAFMTAQYLQRPAKQNLNHLLHFL